MKRNRVALLIMSLILISSVSMSCFPQTTWDLVPSEDDTYDVGSATLRWQDGYYSGDIYVDGDINSNNDDLTIVTGVGNTMVLDTPVWTDLSISMANTKTPASNAPTWRYFQGTEVPAFSASQVNVLYFTAQLPHSYKEGSDLEFHIHISYPDANVGDSRWYFNYSWANDDAVFAVPTIVLKTVASPTTTNYHQRADIATTISGVGKKISSVLVCSIQRLGNVGEDTYANEIYLLSGDFHYQIDTIGSRTQLVK